MEESPLTGKRKSEAEIRGDDETISSAKRHKRIKLSLTKPSYLLGLGPTPTSFRWEHRHRLCKILCELVGRHNWREASGVLSVLMQGTKNERSPYLNRLKYSACIEILRWIRGQDINTSKISHIYDTWISRIGSTKDKLIEDRLVVYLEQVILFLTEENHEDASQAASSLMQHREFGTRPMSYLVIGLTFYQLWYSKFLKEVQEDDTDHTPSHFEMPEHSFDNPVEDSHNNSICSSEPENSDRHDSQTSVMNNKNVRTASIETKDRETTRGLGVKPERDDLPIFTQPLRVCSASEENRTSSNNDASHIYDASVISALGDIDSWLLPLRLPRDSEYYIQMLNHPYYKDAVKHLRLAIHSSPPQFAALQPLVQLLLVGGQVDDAMNEVEKLRQNLDAVPLSRMRACILECFNPASNILSSYYEDILVKDPTCCNSLSKLINMHQNGDYSPESLVEFIALHLDATFPGHNTWREFAECLLKLHQGDEDRMSICLNGNEAKRVQTFSVRYNRTPKILTNERSGNAWRFRCRWWLRRHFSNSALSSDIAKGDLHLLACKAACASHMYGQECSYVVQVYGHLKNTNCGDLLKFLNLHMHNSIRICPDPYHANKII